MSSRKTASPKRSGNRRHASARRAGLFTDLPELKVARALWQNNKLMESCQAFEQIVQSCPANIPALIDASRALGKLYRYGEAESYLNRVTEVGIRSAKAHYLSGQSYRLIRRMDQAIDCLQKAIEIDGGLSDAHLELAIIYERRNDLDRALEHAEARLGCLANDSEATFLTGRILRRQKQFERGLKILDQVASNRNSHWMTRSRAFAELALTHEQKGNFDQAWQSMLAGKELLRPHANVLATKRTRVLPILMQLAKQIRTPDLEYWRNGVAEQDATHPMLLTGIPRSGTTLLGQRLGQHTSICFADEYNVFPHICFPLMLGETPPENLTIEMLNGIPQAKIEMVRKSYYAMFASAVPASMERPVLLDKNPSLLPLLIPYLRTFPHAKLIIAMRDPRDTLVSCLMTYMPLNDFSVDTLDIGNAVQRLELELTGWAQLKDRLPPLSWMEIRYEDVVCNCREQTEKILTFYGLDPKPPVEGPPRQTQTELADVFSPSYAEVAQPISNQAVGRWVHFQEQLKPCLSRLENIARNSGYSI